jgi:Domain of unknown function (DUF1707)
MTDDATDGRPWPIDPAVTPPSPTIPRPIPEAAAPDGDPTTAPVSDDDRQRYGVLLDKAAERGLLGPADYEVRLGELSTATSVDQMRRIVTELPAFSAPTGPLTTGRPRGARPGRSRTAQWVLLALVVVVVVASMVFFALYAQHLVHNHHTGLARPGWPAPAFSALRP